MTKKLQFLLLAFLCFYITITITIVIIVIVIIIIIILLILLVFHLPVAHTPGLEVSISHKGVAMDLEPSDP